MRHALLAFAASLAAAAAVPATAEAQSPPSEAPDPADPAAPAAPDPVPAATFGPPSQVTQPPPAPAAPRPVDSSAKLYNEDLVLGLSLGGTLLSWGLFVSGLQGNSGSEPLLGLLGTVFAPNLGHWAQGVPFTRGTGIRILSGVTASYGFIRAAFCEDTCDDTDTYLFLGSVLVYIAATVDDILDAPRRARRHNQRVQLGITPMVSDRATGLALGGSF